MSWILPLAAAVLTIALFRLLMSLTGGSFIIARHNANPPKRNHR